MRLRTKEVETEVDLLIITSKDPLRDFGLPIPANLDSAYSKFLILRRITFAKRQSKPPIEL